MKPIVIIFALSLALLFGCEKSSPPPLTLTSDEPDKISAAGQIPLSTSPLLQIAIEPTLVEMATAALPVWRETQGSKPALVLLSQDPFLAPIPEQLRAEALQLVLAGSRETLLARAATPVADPLLLPAMALSAALEAGLFSRVVWVLPSKGTIDQFNLEIFREQLLGLGAADQAEAASFSLTAPGVFAGSIRGVPFQAVHPDALPELAVPVVLHLDMSFLVPLYQGEIKTPLYPLLAKVHATLREQQWQAAAVTISASNLNGVIPLASRFVAGNIAELYRGPAMLDGEMPALWDLRARALYLENFFKKEEVRALYEEMESKGPNDPAVKYALYQLLRQFKEGDMAIEKLAQAVKLDPIYALEYLALADVALEQNIPSQVERMLTLASEALPGNVFIKLRLAGHLQTTGQTEMAEKLLVDLRRQPWSQFYYPDMAKHLE